MPDALQTGTPTEPGSGRGHGRFLLLIVVAVAVLFAVIYFWSPNPPAQTAGGTQGRVPLGPDEKSYAPKVQVEKIELTRAENFLHQEVTTMTGEVVNTGNRPIAALQLTVEFSDSLSQVILRDSRSVLAAGSPMAPGERRVFEISFDHVPDSWNMQQPVVRVSGLQFAPSK